MRTVGDLVSVFVKDGKGKIYKGKLISRMVVRNFPETMKNEVKKALITNQHCSPNFAEKIAQKLQFVFLPTQATIKDAKKAFNAMCTRLK